ncbi:MAG TPA: hypothetical protein VJ624_07805 [Thermodesulfobacteriota bacterium]|nr:hypothetical protein [Thermodesulfobacteriota bacterium]
MNLENFSTQEVSSIVLKRLFDKSLSSVEISRFIKDVVNIIDDDEKITLSEVIQKLETLGWGKEVIDPTILELIRLLSPNSLIQKSDQGHGRDKGSYQKPF